MGPRNSVAHESQTELVPGSVPRLSAPVAAQLYGLVDFSVSKAFVLTFVPTYPAKHAHVVGKFVREIESETVFDAALPASSHNIRLCRGPVDKGFDCLAIAPHVGVVHIAEKQEDGLAVFHDQRPQLQLYVLRTRSSEIEIKVGAVRYFGHQAFGKPQAPVAVFIFHDYGEGVAAG